MGFYLRVRKDEPTEDSQNQVENEERAENHQTDKINPGQLEPYGIIHLQHRGQEVRMVDERRGKFSG